MVGGKQPKLVQLRFVRWRWSGEAVRARLGPARAHLVVEKGWQWNERLLLVGTMDGGGGGGQGDLMVWERQDLPQVAHTRLGMASVDSAIDVDACCLVPTPSMSREGWCGGAGEIST